MNTAITIEQSLAACDSHDLADLAIICHRARPMARSNAERLERGGLIEFSYETRRGTTWYRATARGRAVLAMARERGEVRS